MASSVMYIIFYIFPIDYIFMNMYIYIVKDDKLCLE